MDFYKCPFCDVIKFQLRKYLTHLQLLHNHQPNFSVVCNIDGCNRTYRTVPCLRNHIYRKHRGALNASSSVGPLEQIEDDVVRSIDDGDDDDDEDDVVQERCMQRHDLETLMSGLKRHVALFVIHPSIFPKALH